MLTRYFTLAVATLLGLLILADSANTQSSHPDQGERCGPLENSLCRYGLWCEFDAGSCDSSRPGGACVKIPEDCRNAGIRTICGCNGKAYRSDCERRLARVQKMKDGPCP
jgi:hypothetical protein